jgi:hypothetical protein
MKTRKRRPEEKAGREGSKRRQQEKAAREGSKRRQQEKHVRGLALPYSALKL